MMELSRNFILEALSARSVTAVGPAFDQVSEVHTDSRALPGDALFVALVGDRFDGHAFVESALGQGACAAIVQEEKLPVMSANAEGFERSLIFVDDTLLALQDLAAAWLQKCGVKRVALTGSNGKTSTKELVSAALRGVLGAHAVHQTKGNLNNHIGLPLSALGVRSEHQVVVLEMGMNHPGEIALLTQIAQPHVGVVTNIGGAHAGNLGGIEGVARAKGELFEGLDDDATAVVNLEDARCVSQADRATGPRVTFGRTAQADVRICSVANAEPAGLDVVLQVGDIECPMRVPLDGAHNAMNAAAAVAVAVAMGLDPTQAAAGVGQATPPPGRLLRRVARCGALIVDDTYNANPDSARAGLQTLTELAGQRRKVAALGEMLELGDDAEDEHRQVGKAVAQAGVELLFACGELGRAYGDGASLGGGQFIWAPDSTALAALVENELRAEDVMLVKGSRGARMERVVHRVVDDSTGDQSTAAGTTEEGAQ